MFPQSPVLFQSIANGTSLKMADIAVPKRNEKFEALMDKKFLQTASSTTNTMMNRALYDSLDDTDHFIYELKIVSESEKIPLSAIFNQLSPSGASFLHVAVSKKRTEIVELIASNFQHLLTKENVMGDTPLHLATRGGDLATMKILLSYGRHYALRLTRMKNRSGNVPLHEAVLINFKHGVLCLFSDDPSATHSLNEEKESPLYIAARNRDKESLQILLEAPVDDRMLSKIPLGNSPLHAAISTSAKDIGEEVLKRNKKYFESTDENGSTPLHWAVSIDGRNPSESKKIRYLIRKTNPKCELQWNENGDLPIHIACKLGKVEVVEELLQSLEWPDPTTLLNKKGQNILHVAAEYGQERVIWFIIKRAMNLLNTKDSEGNTPLHIATLHQHPLAVFSLLWNGKADFNLTNRQGLTAVDLVFYKSDAPLTTRQMITHTVLVSVNAKVRPDIQSTWLRLWLEPKQRVIKENINILLIIATLIATVTFAAGFTLPGGIIQSGETDAGQPVFMNETMFGVFVSINAIAFQFSIGSVLLTLLCSIVPDKYLGGTATSVIALLLAAAVFLMSCAFMASLSLVTKKSGGQRKFLALLDSVFLGCVFSPLILVIPYCASKGYMRYFHYYVVVRVMMMIGGGFTQLKLEKMTAIQSLRDSDAPSPSRQT